LTVKELFSVQEDLNKLKSLTLELARINDFNPYKGNIITDMPRGGEGKDFNLWYVTEKKRIEEDITFYREKLQRDRERVDEYIESLPHPENDIVRFRAINDLSWEQIGSLVGYSGRNASRMFYKIVKLSEMSNMSD
jgi:DNA-directed RNA polymerase specialized sigma24 family protein